MKRVKKTTPTKEAKQIQQGELEKVNGGNNQQTQTSCTTYPDGSRVCTGQLGPVVKAK
ncbi:hypothetical protein [Legionella hackeliae]|uniref:Uncharacterized protein n=1 Tax=Legionella hackeliae TaxID=449 RepID=A0A0A8UUI1_LEGHA|nr:hypothetical protein [Legionella hackeliae]KTD11434.1 hypothetical protein Lhac_1830 [Legionella hackeliae]CEK10737.1 protein of unknown function [Legionella hackeliae]STX47484.1 Uncharacterised protein [Legionella hackeliae]